MHCLKKVLVIGGSYFYGRVFVETLLERGDCEITVLNRGRIPFRDSRVTEIVCDRHEASALRAALLSGNEGAGGWDTVVDFCAYTAADIRGMIDALRFSGKQSVGRYVLISTCSVYGNQAAAVPLTEEAPLLESPLPENEDYGYYVWNKRQAEAELLSLCGNAGIEWTILRPAIVFGKYNYAPRESLFFDRITAGEELIIPETADTIAGADLQKEARFSFVSVWDAAALTAACLDSPAAANTCFNLAAPEAVGYSRFAGAVKAAAEQTAGQQGAGIQVWIRKLPLSEIINRRLPLPFPPDRCLLYDGSAAARRLGFSYSPFETEMVRTWKYYLAGRGINPRTLKEV